MQRQSITEEETEKFIPGHLSGFDNSKEPSIWLACRYGFSMGWDKNKRTEEREIFLRVFLAKKYAHVDSSTTSTLANTTRSTYINVMESLLKSTRQRSCDDNVIKETGIETKVKTKIKSKMEVAEDNEDYEDDCADFSEVSKRLRHYTSLIYYNDNNIIRIIYLRVNVMNTEVNNKNILEVMDILKPRRQYQLSNEGITKIKKVESNEETNVLKSKEQSQLFSTNDEDIIEYIIEMEKLLSNILKSRKQCESMYVKGITESIKSNREKLFTKILNHHFLSTKHRIGVIDKTNDEDYSFYINVCNTVESQSITTVQDDISLAELQKVIHNPRLAFIGMSFDMVQPKKPTPKPSPKKAAEIVGDIRRHHQSDEVDNSGIHNDQSDNKFNDLESPDERNDLSLEAPPQEDNQNEESSSIDNQEKILLSSALHSVQEQHQAMNYSEMEVMLVNCLPLVNSPEQRSCVTFGIGLACNEQKKYEQAAEWFKETEEKQQECYRVTPNPQHLNNISLCRYYVAEIDIDQGYHKLAIDHLKESINAHQPQAQNASTQPHLNFQQLYELPHITLSAKLAKLALALRCINHIADSEDCYRKALNCSDITLADEISTHSSFGNLLHSVGDNERAVLEYKLAIEKAEKAIELATKDMTEADMLQQKSFDGEDNESAAKAFEEASQCLTDAQLSLTWAHGNLGNAYLSLGKYEKSLNHLQTSLDLTIKHEPSPSALSRALNNLGTVYQNMSKLDEAETHYDEALAQALYCDDRAAQARAFGNIGNLYMIKKNYQKAIPHYTEVLRLCKDRSTVYVAYHNRGCSFFELAEKRKSEQLSTWKRDEYQFVAFGFAARDVENKNQIRELEDNILHLYQQAQKDYNKVIKNLETAFSSISASPKGLDLYVSLFESNSKTFTRAQDCAYNLGDHHMALVYAEQARARTLGELLLKRTGVPLKSPLSVDSINSIMRQMKPHIPVVVLSYTGTRLLVWALVFDGFKVLMSGFEQEPSSELFEGKSLDMYLRYRLGEDLTSNIDIYKEEKDIATNDLSHPSSNPDICYSNNEMEEIGHSYANKALEETAQFAESRKEEKGDEEKGDKEKDWTPQDLDNSMINEEATPIFAASANQSIFHTAPTAKSKANILSSFHKYVGVPLQYTLKSLLTSAPSEASTAKIILVPDSSTKMIPFTALNDGEECFGDKFAIQYSPSLLAMGVLNQVPSTVINISNHRNVLIVGDPQTPPFKFKGDDWMLGELPFARKEAQWVGHYTNTIPLLGKDPTKDIVISRLRQAKLIHLAAHGSATHSFIALAGHQIQSMFNTYVVQDANSLLLYANDVLSLQLQPSLVILSSCDSGKGIFKGDDIQGLSRAFLLAGAQAVMTAIWKVPDESASFFMQFFYRYLLDGYTSTLALHKSIISIRCFLMFSQYIHWGGYQLTGNDVTLQVATAEDDDRIQTVLGRPSGCSPFPRLDYILDLEKNLLSNRDDSNVQVIRGPNNVEICEPVTDFIIKHYSCYRAIIWINSINISCLLDRAEKKELLSPSLIVIDNATLECLSQLKPLRNIKECHLILLVRSMILEDEDISREIHRVLLRGVDILPYVLPLTQLQVTQRLVYNVLKDNQFSPNNHDQHNFQSLATMCRGSEVLVRLTQALLAQNIKKSNGDVQYCLDLLKNEIEDTYDNNFHDVLHEDWTASINDVSRSTLTLLKSFAISPASQYLLNCLSVLAGTPIPSSFLLSLESEIEAKVTDVSEVSPIKELKQMNCLLQYPSTVILRGTTDNDVNNSLYYVPVIIGDSIWDYALTDTDQVVAISTLMKIMKKQPLHNPADHGRYMHQMLELILYKYNVLIKPHTSTSEDISLDDTTSDISILEDSASEDSSSSVHITSTSGDLELNCLIDILSLKEILSVQELTPPTKSESPPPSKLESPPPSKPESPPH